MLNALMALARYLRPWSRAPSGTSRRHFASASGRPSFCFDIDGVLLRGKTALPGARDSLLRLAAQRVPWLLVTNGGGVTEARKAAELSKILELPVHPEQVVLSHSPIRELCPTYRDKPVLVLGARDVVGVARSYGLRYPLTSRDLEREDPHRWPFAEPPHAPAPLPHGLDLSAHPIAAVMILHDPNNVGAELQIVLDALRGGHPLGSGPPVQSIPLYSSNPDLLFPGAYGGKVHAVVRLAAGSFLVAMAAVWRAVTGTELRVTQFGKPTRETFAFAGRQLARWTELADADGLHDAVLRAAARGEHRLFADESVARLEEGAASEIVQAHHAHPPLHHHAHAGVGSAGAYPQAAHGPASAGAQPARDLHSEALAALAARSAQHRAPLPRHIFFVGDNPRADIRGANAAGDPWRSLLVRTGVFRGGDNDPVDPAHAVFPSVAEAVEYGLQAGDSA